MNKEGDGDTSCEWDENDQGYKQKCDIFLPSTPRKSASSTTNTCFPKDSATSLPNLDQSCQGASRELASIRSPLRCPSFAIARSDRLGISQRTATNSPRYIGSNRTIGCCANTIG
jgi:hypothetical protein